MTPQIRSDPPLRPIAIIARFLMVPFVLAEFVVRCALLIAFMCTIVGIFVLLVIWIDEGDLDIEDWFHPWTLDVLEGMR